MGCTHHLLKCVNCVCYCQICGARVDMPKPENDAPPAPANEKPVEAPEPENDAPPAPANEKPVEAPEPPTKSANGRKIGFNAEETPEKKPATRRGRKKGA